MREKRLTEMEKYRLKIIKETIQKKIDKLAAAVKLNCSKRNINILINKYLQDGFAAFIHKNTGRICANKISDEINEQILFLYETKYKDFNFAHFYDKLVEVELINVSYKHVRMLLMQNGYFSSRCWNATFKRIVKELANNDETKQYKQTQEMNLKRSIINKENAHPMQDRKENTGERVQTDASIHNWIDAEKWALHAFIDDATGKILSASFDKQETLQGYYTITKEMFENYGMPQEILTDRRTVFWSTKEKESELHSDSLTQYGFMCSNLGIKLTKTSIPQAKGRIERLWNTLQDRLPKEFKLNGINDIDQANEFLKKYIIWYNNKFSIQDNNIKNNFQKFPQNLDIDFVLGRRFERIVNNGGTIKYMNKYYIPYFGDEPVIFKNKTKIFVVKTFNNQLYANSWSDWYQLIEVKQNSTYKEKYAAEFKSEVNPKLKNSSPWKYTNWIFFKSNMKKRNFRKF